ncbi:MAG: ATP-binding cassette domain-containing protein, partial [Chloroflexota bacterium]|nr:ATP-binding cassette domain-containing protein [Chloroflexota bacterium]
MGYLRQGFADLPGASLTDLLDAPTRGLLTALRQLEAVTAAFAIPGTDQDAVLGAYDLALAAFEARGGYAAVDELLILLEALGVGGVDLATPLEALSGGQKTRAGLAALLASRPDLLLLDEPTNHLDGDALLWLERFVREYRGAVLVVSHDRAFLDAVVSTVLELNDLTHTITAYGGGYSAYLEAKQAEEAAHADAYARQQREIARIERDIQAVASHAMATELSTHHFFPRARAKRVARTAKVRERKLEKQLASEEMVELPERRWGLALDFGEQAESGRDVAIVEAADVELGGRRILQDIDLHVRFGERIALTGPNGGG